MTVVALVVAVGALGYCIYLHRRINRADSTSDSRYYGGGPYY